MIKDKKLTILKEHIKVKKHEQTITHMKQLLAKKDLDTRDDLLKEIKKEKKVAQEVEDRAARVERKAELANNLHCKLLLAEKRKSAAAAEKISFLMQKLHDLNYSLAVSPHKQWQHIVMLLFKH
ncbi:hypothetical protein D4764_15G0007580 [Takifugu flavidus]|uniref:Uncharacterized protein n=1 Tax=Takifugu flavidus TaxID=433684 RepID=A0A5C6P0R0_9TELE|nr:hypothetical protein D4764_15G0007580 [Takifugu flavidus]